MSRAIEVIDGGKLLLRRVHVTPAILCLRNSQSTTLSGSNKWVLSRLKMVLFTLSSTPVPVSITANSRNTL